MSIECPECYAENVDHAIVCINCHCPLTDPPVENEECENNSVPELYIWKVKCPVDGRLFEVSGPDYCCVSCPYSADVDFFDSFDCKPYRIKANVQIPDEEYVKRPLLALEEIEAEFDENNIAKATCNPYKIIHIPIIIEEDCLIGRSGNIAVDYFSKDLYISEKHCTVSLNEVGWFVERQNSVDGNPTCVNGIELSPKIKTKVNDGSLLQIADKLFVVTLRGMSMNSNKNESSYKWIITCPRCGKKHTVLCEDSRIDICDNCDEFDKFDIANERAVRIDVDR